nr:MAG TPA: hypothetical protein [Caudoviricetes sp.]
MRGFMIRVLRFDDGHYTLMRRESNSRSSV